MRARKKPLEVPTGKITNGTVIGAYDGRELGRTCHRPGAYDFMDIPSLRNGERVPMGRIQGVSSRVPIQLNFRDV